MRHNTIYRSLNEERMFGGVQRDLVIANALFLALAVLGLGWWWWFAPAFALHYVMRNINKRDPKIVQVYRAYTRFANRYDPWPSVAKQRNARPIGYSPHTLC